MLLTLITVPAFAQSPAERWLTVTTPHFRVHYPVQYEAWAQRAASTLESERAAVARETGYEPGQITDVLVINPIADANGLTYPLLDGPRIVLYTEPPSPESQIGENRDWIDLLTVHEVTHLVHLLRPARNPRRQLLAKLLPLNPITLDAPRWVLEGYATVVEGRLTGSGRPAGAMRAAVLRRFAQSGRLPTYGELNGNRSFLGRSMAYLMGSAFLEWLEQHAAPGSLRRLWARMTARRDRTFDEAFEGVYGDRPDRLYGRFVAELTTRAMRVDSNAPGEGTLWQETTRNSGEPAVSPDGSMIAVVIRTSNKPDRIVIWSTSIVSEEEKKQKEELAKMLARDPGDVAPVTLRPLSRKPLHSLSAPDGGELEGPRWTSDGTLLFSHRQPDHDGFLHHDLFAWSPKTNARRRVTTLADVSEADPIAGTGDAIAVRNRNGYSQLVLVRLASGVVTALTEPSIGRIVSHPRASPDGQQIVYARHSGGWWRLVVRNLADGRETVLPLADGANVATPEWSRSEPAVIYAAVLAAGYIELHRFHGNDVPLAVTQTIGAAIMPAPAPDGRLFFMSLERDGYTLRVLDPATQPVLPLRAPSDLLATPAAKPFETSPVSIPRPYGPGRQEVRWLIGETFSAVGNATELGARLGDVIGRLDTIAIASIGNGPRGVALASAWRGWPVKIAAHAFRADRADAPRSGVELRGDWNRVFPLARVELAAGALAGTKSRLFAQGTLATRQIHGALVTEQFLLAEADRSGTSLHQRAVGKLALRAGSIRFGARYERDAASAIRDDFDEIAVGGPSTSITPPAARSTRIDDPALDFRSLAGRRYEGRRLEAGSGMIDLFWQQHRSGRDRLSLAGAEIAMRSEALPIFRLPRVELRAGIARLLGSAHRTRAWFGLSWRP